jgi:hypothetical protein
VVDQLLSLLVFASFSTVVVVEVFTNCYRVAKAIDQTFFIRMVDAGLSRSTLYCSRCGTCRSCW